MKIENINFEEYLKMSHASEYAGVDDDMPDDFDRWVGEEHEHDAFESEIQYYMDALLTSAKEDIYDYIEKEFGYRRDIRDQTLERVWDFFKPYIKTNEQLQQEKKKSNEQYLRDFLEELRMESKDWKDGTGEKLTWDIESLSDIVDGFMHEPEIDLEAAYEQFKKEQQ